MTDTPLDLDAVSKRAEFAATWRHLWAKESLHAADNLALASMRAAKELAVDDVPALLAEVETLRTQLAEAQLEATKLATEGEWDYEYGMNALVTGHFIAYNSEGEARAWVAVHEQPLMRRRRWRGPVQAAEETTE